MVKWACLVSVVAACVTDPTTSNSRSGTDPRVDVAGSYCAYMDRCFPTDFASSYGDVAHCSDVMVAFLKSPPAGAMSTCAADFDAEDCVGKLVAPDSCAAFGFVHDPK